MDELTQLVAQLSETLDGLAKQGDGGDASLLRELSHQAQHIRDEIERITRLTRGDFNGVPVDDAETEGGARTLRENLGRLLWVMRSVAGGDLSQRIEGFGDVGKALDEMVNSLRDARERLIEANQTLRERNRLLQNAYDAIDREFEEIADIQTNLLPRAVPSVPRFRVATHYLTATKAGGDYYDFVPRADGSLGVLLADVAGHGSPAAVGMAMTRVIFHSIRDHVLQPEDIIHKLNSELRRNILDGMFVTCTYCVFDADALTLTYASAGHEPALLVARKSDGVRELWAQSPPLAILDTLDTAQETLQLAPGDKLVLYTDGLSWAANAKNERFTLDRMKRIAQRHLDSDCEGLEQAILGELEEFRDGLPLDDDVTLLVVEVM